MNDELHPDQTNSGYHPTAHDFAEINHDWSVPLSDSIIGVAAADGMVYAVAGSVLIALDADQGKEQWRAQYEGPIYGPKMHQGIVLITRQDSARVEGLNPDTGQPEFTFSPGKFDYLMEFATDGQSLFLIGIQDKFLRPPKSVVIAVDPFDRTIRWRERLNPSVTPSIDEQHVYVKTHGSDTSIVAIDKERGKRVWCHEPATDIIEEWLPVYENKLVYTEENGISCISTVDGTRQWTTDNTYWTSTLPTLGPAGVVIASSTPDQDSRTDLTLFEAKTGETIWSTTINAELAGHPARPTITTGQVLLLSGDGRLLSFDCSSGERQWTLRISEIEEMNTIRVATAQNNLYLCADGLHSFSSVGVGSTQIYMPSGFEYTSNLSPSVMYCPQCGEQLTDYDSPKYCPSCGTSLDEY